MRISGNKTDPSYKSSIAFAREAIVLLDNNQLNGFITADTETGEVLAYERDENNNFVVHDGERIPRQVTKKGKVEIFLQCQQTEARGHLISKKDLGDDWPFIDEIVEGFVFNRNGTLTFRYMVTEFALNGMAESQGREPIDCIWASQYPDAQHEHLKKIKKPIDKIIEFGLNIKDR